MRRTRRIAALIAELALIAGSVVSCDNWGVESIIGGKKADEKTETGTNSGNGLTPNTPVNVPVERVVISPSGDLGGAVGGFMPLIATVYPPEATNKVVIWEPSDENIVEIGKDSGLVTLMVFKNVSGAEGVTITVKTAEGNFTDSRKVKVVEPVNMVPATGVSIEGSPPVEGFVGDYLQLVAKVTPEDATNQGVEWESSDPDTALVVGGLVILRKETAGVTITAKAGGGSDTRTIKINPVPVASIELTPTSLNLDAGGSVVPLTATVLPANATNKSVTWNSSNTTVATVSNGVVTSVAPGTATITARSISNTTVTKTCAVTVKAAGPVSLPAINTYVYIPGGTVASGYAWGVSKTRTVGSFAISRTEVHYELWYKVKEWGIGNGYTFQNPGQAGSTGGTGAAVTDTNKDQPVTTVSWRDAVVWCNAYSEMTGEGAVYRNNSNAILKDSTNKGDGLNVENLVDKNKVALYNGYRLPTEEEWEYAARGGVPSSGVPWTYTYAGSNTVDDVAWLSGNSGFKTHSVGWKPPNSAGLYDMSGNVWEFCFAASGAELVDRGGNFGSAGGECAVAYSPNCVPDYVSPGQGFRLVCR